MQRFRWFTLLVAAPTLLALTLSGCKSRSDEDEDNGGGRRRSRGGPAVAVKETPLDIKATTTVKGRVVYDGDPPGRQSLKSQVEQNKTDSPHCLADPSKDSYESAYWKVNKDNKGVQDVVVFLRAPKGKTFPEAFVKKVVPEKPVVIDQPYCAFEPHVSVLLPGQKLIIENDAPFLHNTNYNRDDPTKPATGNITLPGKTDNNPPHKQEITGIIPDSKKPIQLSCQVHPWMRGYLWAPETPLAAVTDKDGNFEIKNVPVGTELRLAVWHEQPGFFGEGGVEGKAITIKENEALPEIKVKAK